MEHQALHDPLTALPNRLLLEDRFSLAMAQAKRSKRSLALAFLDLDGFKEANDRFGHASGDQELILLAKRLQGVLRTSDTVSRKRRACHDDIEMPYLQANPARSANSARKRKMLSANKPTPDGLDLTYFRNRLSLDLIKTNEAIEESRKASTTIELDQSCVGRLSRMDALQQQAIAQGMTERLQLQKRKLKAALDRIDSGIFGLCCACGGDLEHQRLHADPCTLFCLPCVEERSNDK